MSEKTQNFGNHARFVPAFHFVLAPLLLANVVYAAVHAWRLQSRGAIMGFALSLGLIVVWFYMRVFAVTVQDRVIRLEESLRYQKVLPADLQARAGSLTLRQIIGLRFASDAELPGLVKRALDENLSEKAIKQAVGSWRGDYLRA